MSVRRILIPADLSGSSQDAVEFVKKLAPESEVRFLHVLTTGKQSTGNVIASTGELNRNKAAAESSLNAIAKRIPLASTEISLGAPADEIVRIADEWNADCIVIPRHNDRRLQHLIVGSVTAKVLRTANCPVVVVPPSADRES